MTYDLKQAGQNYACISKKLEAYQAHWHMQGSVWIIQTSKSAAQIRDELKACLDQNDTLFVARLEGESAWHGFSDKAGVWLKSKLESKV
ncbi:MAG: hypothetical protein IPK75_05325 [Acidobacteria bacterium]|nr:hypothetical protein [Acidobacteriota bacterium]